MMRNSKKLGASALVLVAAMVTVGIYCIIEEVKEENEKKTQYNIEKRLRDLEKARENEGPKYNYYNNLREKCKAKDSYNCCLASVDKIEELNVKAFGEGKCEDGFEKDALKCVDSYNWCKKSKFSKNKVNINTITVSNKVMSVSELVNSKVPENNYVKIKAKVGKCVKLKASTDYEGVPAGCRIYDKNNKNLIVSTDTFFTQKDSEIIVGGNVVYCGDKKRDKYICALKNTKIINKITKDIEKNNPFKSKK